MVVHLAGRRPRQKGVHGGIFGESRHGGSMNRTLKRVLTWTPRVLCIAFAAFISLFALDVFQEGLGMWQVLAALAIHLIPTALLVGVLLLAWRWEWVGTLAFLAMACFYIVETWGRFPILTYLLIAGPLILIALLFGINWLLRRELRAS